MCRSLFSCLSLMVMVFGLVIVALSTSYVAQSSSVAAVIHCINGLNVTASIGVMLMILSLLMDSRGELNTIAGISPQHLLRYAIITSLSMTAASFILQIVFVGAYASLYIWMAVGVTLALMLYVVSLLLVRKRRYDHVSQAVDVSV